MFTIETEVFNYETEEGKVKEIIFNYDEEMDLICVDVGKRGFSFTWEEWKEINRILEDERDDSLSPFKEYDDECDCENCPDKIVCN